MEEIKRNDYKTLSRGEDKARLQDNRNGRAWTSHTRTETTRMPRTYCHQGPRMWAEDLTPGALGLERGGRRNGGAGDGTRAPAANKILKETRKLRNVSRRPLRLVARGLALPAAPRLGRGRGGWARSRRRRDSVCRRRLRRGICKHIQESLVTEEAQGLGEERGPGGDRLQAGDRSCRRR